LYLSEQFSLEDELQQVLGGGELLAQLLHLAERVHVVALLLLAQAVLFLVARPKKVFPVVVR